MDNSDIESESEVEQLDMEEEVDILDDEMTRLMEEYFETLNVSFTEDFLLIFYRRWILYDCYYIWCLN